MRLKGRLKNPMTSGIEPVAFGLVARYLNHLRYRVPQKIIVFWNAAPCRLVYRFTHHRALPDIYTRASKSSKGNHPEDGNSNDAETL
jgi:hypothetical protein